MRSGLHEVIWFQTSKGWSAPSGSEVKDLDSARSVVEKAELESKAPD